jgi:hypothetical protein
MDLKKFLSRLPEEEKKIIFTLSFFPEFFSVDWFQDIKPSQLVSVILNFERNQWIVPIDGSTGSYNWSPKFPRQEVISEISQEQVSSYYRTSADILLKNLNVDDKSTLMIACQYITAGLR